MNACAAASLVRETCPARVQHLSTINLQLTNRLKITYLVCYDIAEDKRRDRVFKVCKNHGLHLQFSVFECDLNATQLTGLQRELAEAISLAHDQVLFVSLGPAEGRGERVITALGRPYTKMDAPCYVV